MWHVPFHVSHVTCHLPPVTCHLPTIFYTEKNIYFGFYPPLQLLWHTYGHNDYMTDLAQRAKSVKIQPPISSCFDIRAIFDLRSFWTNGPIDQTILGRPAARPGLAMTCSKVAPIQQKCEMCGQQSEMWSHGGTADKQMQITTEGMMNMGRWDQTQWWAKSTCNTCMIENICKKNVKLSGKT